MDTAEAIDIEYEKLDDHMRCLYAARAVEAEGGSIEDVIHAVEKPWNYKVEIVQWLHRED